MIEIPYSVLFHTIVFLAIPLFFGITAIRLGIPVIIGYILSGCVVGFFFPSVLSDIVGYFASFGLILLLFTVGLEVDLKSFRKFGRFVVLGGLLQIFITALILFSLALFFGKTLLEALVLAIGFSFSSTAIVSKIIQERGLEHSLLGQLSIGILVFQDLAVIPFLLIISAYNINASFSSTIIALMYAVIKSAVIIALVYYIGNKVIPIIFNILGSLSRELINLFTIIFIFATVSIFSYFGLSPSVAAFIAGIVLGQSLEHYHIFSQIRPLRDIFTILFFVFLGITFNLGTTFTLLPSIVFFTLALIAIKVIVLIFIMLFFRFHSKTAFSISIMLSQVGEFAFILFAQAQLAGIISKDAYLFGVGVCLISLAITPIIIDREEFFYKAIRNYFKTHLPFVENFVAYAIDREPAHIDAFEIERHVVICGYGRVGSYIGRALTLAKIPFIAIDYNRYVVEKARSEGINIIYGDPTDIDILDFAQVEKAICIIVAVPQQHIREAILLSAKALNSDIIVFSRVGEKEDQKRLKDLGAEVVIQPEFEAAISIVRKILLAYNMSRDEIIGKIKRLRIEHGIA